MSNVVDLHGGVVPGDPDPEIIAILERLLADAKAGRLTGVAYAVCYGNGAQATGWDGIAGTRHPLGTAIMMLNSRYASRLMED